MINTKVTTTYTCDVCGAEETRVQEVQRTWIQLTMWQNGPIKKDLDGMIGIVAAGEQRTYDICPHHANDMGVHLLD